MNNSEQFHTTDIVGENEMDISERQLTNEEMEGDMAEIMHHAFNEAGTREIRHAAKISMVASHLAQVEMDGSVEE